jgi:putative hemolysin
MTVVSPAHALSRPAPAPHIVDVLIAERAPRLSASGFWPLLRPALYAGLHYASARRMADAISGLPGRQALDYVAGLLAVDVSVRGLDRVPAGGRAIVVCNHPTGIADGLAVYDALKARRPDLMFYANSDAHRISPRLEEVLIPVEWVEAKRTRERTRRTLELTRRALEAERCLAIFPAGRLARRGPGGQIVDPVWMATAVSLARRYDAPVIPMHLTGPPSRLFHLFNRLSPELRDITLFHEMLNKRGRRFDLSVGPAIAPDRFEGTAQDATAALKAYVEQTLAQDPDRPFP